jgi:phosphoglycolate phosphatase-like HAD superfamily hydrolase
MEKPIIFTNLDGLLIKHEAFIKPHKAWFHRAIKKTGDKSLRNWIGKPDYFKGVNIAMEKIMPNSSQEKKTLQARKWYQKDIIEYIRKNPKVIIKKNVKILKNLREKYKLILVTTNTKKYINKIIKVSKLQNIYDVIIASKTEKEPNKKDLIKEAIKNHGKPKYYITGKENYETINYLKKLKIKVITEKEITSFF